MPLVVQPVSASHVPAARPIRSGSGAPVFASGLRDQHVWLRTHRFPFAIRPGFPDLGPLTSGPPPHPTGIRPLLPTNKMPAGKGTGRMVPTLGSQPFDRVDAQLCPPNIATATPQAFTVASRVGDLNRPKSHRTQQFRVAVCVAARPRSASIQPLALLRSFRTLASSRTPFCLTSRTRTIWQCWSVPSPSGLLPTRTPRSRRFRLPSASTCPLRRTRSGVLSPPHG